MAVKRTPQEITPPVPPGAPAAGEMALDTLASMLRSMAEFALDQEGTDARTFRQQAEAWAQHVIMAAPVPGISVDAGAGGGGRRVGRGERRGGARPASAPNRGAGAPLGPPGGFWGGGRERQRVRMASL